MIKEYGQVVIREDGVEIVGFRFDCSDGNDPLLEALEWARQLLDKTAEEVAER